MSLVAVRPATGDELLPFDLYAGAGRHCSLSGLHKENLLHQENLGPPYLQKREDQLLNEGTCLSVPPHEINRIPLSETLISQSAVL
jgi:hypothetical protein